MGYKFGGTNYAIEDDVKTNGCGTYAGYLAHQRAGTKPCTDCKDAANAYGRERYERNKINPPTPKAFRPDKCGTNAGYARHQFYKTTICPHCRKAAAQYIADYRARKGVTSGPR